MIVEFRNVDTHERIDHMHVQGELPLPGDTITLVKKDETKYRTTVRSRHIVYKRQFQTIMIEATIFVD